MGNVYMEAEQVRFKDSTYRDVQTALAAALEGGGGGGTTVVANPEGSATADLAKLQVGTTIYGIPAEAGDISYDNTSSGMTADDVQEAIDELNTGLSGVTELIPSDATSSNKLATVDDIPGTATTSAPGIVQPDGTSITIADGVISAIGGSGDVYSTTETLVGSWLGAPRYRQVVPVVALPNTSSLLVPFAPTGLNMITRIAGIMYRTTTVYAFAPLPFISATGNNVSLWYEDGNLEITTTSDRSSYSAYIIFEYTKSA